MAHVKANDKLLTDVVYNRLENILDELEIKNYTINLSAGTIPGDNYLGIVAKTVVEGEDNRGNSVTLNLIIKSAPRNEIFRKITDINTLYHREIYAYNEVFPAFVKFQQEKGIKKPFAPFAKYYGSSMEAPDEAIIMENMKELGYKLCDRHSPLDYNHVLLMMRVYGKLHALSFAMRDQKPELFEKLGGSMRDTFIKNDDTKEARRAFEEQFNRVKGCLDAVKDKEAMERLYQYEDHGVKLVYNAVQPETAGKYAVLGHGDCWTNNLLFKYNDSNLQPLPEQVCLLDWQLSRLGSPVLDLSYFLFTCTDKEFRDKHYNHIIREYYESFTSFLKELGSDPEELFPFEVLQEHLKKFSIYGFHMAAMVLFLMSSESEEIPSFAENTDANDLLQKFNFVSKNSNKYIEKMRGVIFDFIEYDYQF